MSVEGTHAGRPLRVAVLVKQVPRGEDLKLGVDGRLVRVGPGEINPYCRRAIATGVSLAADSGGRCDLIAMGPPSAADCLMEGLAWGADEAVLLSDPALAGADSIVTARALAALLRGRGPYDLILTGRNSVDADTGQVAPQLAEILGLPLVNAARKLSVIDGRLYATCEYDDASTALAVECPAVVSCAERICDPAKVDREVWESEYDHRVRIVNTDVLRSSGWVELASPTVVGTLSTEEHVRAGAVLRGSLDKQVDVVVRHLVDGGALDRPTLTSAAPQVPRTPAEDLDGPTITVVCEPRREGATAELLGTAAALARRIGGRVVALDADGLEPEALSGQGADEAVRVRRDAQPDEVAMTVASWATEHSPWAILAPSTLWGREVAGRAAARLVAGLTGDAIGLEVSSGRLLAWKPAFGGCLVAAITASSPIQMATVRPGALLGWSLRPPEQIPVHTSITPRTTRVVVSEVSPNDNVEALGRARVVVGVGSGVNPDDCHLLTPLLKLLDAELAATRRVTDRGWLPHSRQVGLTGRSVAPALYFAIGLSGRYNHMVGTRRAGCVIAINIDSQAPVSAFADLTMVADWREAVPALTDSLRSQIGQQRVNS